MKTKNVYTLDQAAGGRGMLGIMAAMAAVATSVGRFIPKRSSTAKLWKAGNRLIDVIHPFKPSGVALPVTRQQRRAGLRAGAIREITIKFPGESRKTRRAMGISLGNRRYRDTYKLPL